MIDTHAHLDFSQFDNDREEVIQRALSNNVKKIINVGCNLERAPAQGWSALGGKASIELAEKHDNIYAAVGIHPSDVSLFCHPEERSDEGSLRCSETKKRRNKETGNWKLEIETIRKMAQHPKVVAIGEIGLDYFHMDSDERDARDIPDGEIKELKAKQKEMFIAQLELAREFGLPVIIHCRDAYEDLLLLLRGVLEGSSASRDNTQERRGNPVIQGVIHCFSGNREQAKQFLDLGFYISFTGNITYGRGRKSSAPILQDVVREIPLDRILIETDCPFLSPIPHRGMRNEPAFVRYVAEKIAEIKNISFEEVERAADGNAERLFDIAKFQN